MLWSVAAVTLPLVAPSVVSQPAHSNEAFPFWSAYSIKQIFSHRSRKREHRFEEELEWLRAQGLAVPDASEVLIQYKTD